MTKKQIFKKLKNDPYLLETIDSHYLSNHDFMLQALSIEPLFSIRFISKELLNNENFMEKAVKVKMPENLLIMAFASEEIRNNKEIMISAIYTNSENLKYAPESIQNNEKIVLEALDEMPGIIKYISSRLINSKNFILKALKISKFVFDYIDDKLQLDEDIIREYLSGIKWLDEYDEYIDYNGRFCVEFNKEGRFDNIKNKKMVMETVKKNPVAIFCASEEFRRDEDVVSSMVGGICWKENMYTLAEVYPEHKTMYEKFLK